MTAPDPLEVELQVPTHRRRITPDDQLAFQQSLVTPDPGDAIDEDLAELPCRVPLPMRKESEARRVLDILDELDGRWGGLKSEDARRECKRIIVASVGQGGFEAFLKSRQPALEDRTGQDLIQNHPAALLKRLRALESQSDGEGGTDE